jgi:hypothetical protein
MLTLEWTDAAAALPDDDTLVLVALENGEVWPAVRDYGRWIYMSGAEVSERVTHWMHLPPAPGAAA